MSSSSMRGAPSSYDVMARWRDALTGFEQGQPEAAPSTTARRLKHLRRFSLWVDASPWHVRPDDVEAWVMEQDVAPTTRSTMRDSLRAFYRWASSSGRMQTDPTAMLSHRALRLPVPEQWSAPLVAYERYLRAKGTAPASVRSYMEQLRTFAREHASLDPFAVTVDDLFEWMAGKHWARETRRARKVTLTGFYGWAVDTNRTDADPTARLPIVKAGDPTARPVTDDEYQSALRAADDPRWALGLRLAAEMGLRRGEVARVHSADITETATGHWLTVHGKGGKLRRLPLPKSLAVALKSRGPGYAFPGAVVERQRAAGEGHISARYMGKRIAELLPTGVTMHGLRHRFATRAYNVDRDVFTVQRLLGHASAATTQRYVQVSDDRMRALVETVAQ